MAEERLAYANSCELLMTLISYAVGLGNIWRFPYLVYENGGGVFLIPYVISLLVLGLPLFILELGYGQLFREGAVNVWVKLRQPRYRGIGVTAAVTTWLVVVYYTTIVAWTLYYLVQSFGSFGADYLPWESEAQDRTCQPTALFANYTEFSPSELLLESGLFNPEYREYFWCPLDRAKRIPQMDWTPPQGISLHAAVPQRCPATAAIAYLEMDVFQVTGDITDLGGFNVITLLSLTATWALVYITVFRGVEVSGKLAYVTSTLPYFCLVAFFFRAITLEGASDGIAFYLTPDLSKLFSPVVWQKAAVQIFFSLGVAFGSIIAFGSYGDQKADFVSHAIRVSLINCGTSVFAGFVVFAILGNLSYEMSKVNPCFTPGDVTALKEVGLQGTGLAFVAFPIAISQMSGKAVWAVLFFLMLFSLGMGSAFSLVEGVMTVVVDSGYIEGRPRWQVAGVMVLLCWLGGLIFVTKSGPHWLAIFDSYSGAFAVFFVGIMECAACMWGGSYHNFQKLAKEHANIDIPAALVFCWTWASPIFMLVLGVLGFVGFDLTVQPGDPSTLPVGYILFGWFLALVPIASFFLPWFTSPKPMDGMSEQLDADKNTAEMVS